MKKINPKRLFFAIFFSLLLTVGLFKVGSHFVTSVKADQLEDLNNQIKEYEAELARLKSQGNTLYNQIAQFNAQIRLTTLKIQETQEKILLLGGRIDQLEISLESLTDAFSMRANEIYKMKRLGDSLMLLVTASNLNEAVSRYHYLQKIQEADRELLVRLQEAQDVYEEEKDDQESLQAQLEQQGQVLGAQKTAKANLLATTQNDEKKYQNLLSVARAQLAALSKFAQSVGVSLIPHQEISDEWGKYYNQRDSNWGNTLINGRSDGCGGACSLASVGCLVTSYTMVVSHYGGSLIPSDVSVNSSNFSVGTALFNNPGPSANGHSATRVDNPSMDKLRDALNSNKAVIVGLSANGGSYPKHYSDHWVVLRSVDGDSFKINDPLYAGAMNVSLKDHYSGWAIIQARIYN